VSPWKGGWLDAGVTALEKRNELNATHSSETHPNLGLEQWFLNRRLALRFGLDETSPTAGLTYKVPPFNLDVAYVRNMAKARSELVWQREQQRDSDTEPGLSLLLWSAITEAAIHSPAGNRNHHALHLVNAPLSLVARALQLPKQRPRRAMDRYFPRAAEPAV